MPIPLHLKLLGCGLVLMLLAVPLLLLGGGAALKTSSFLARAEAGVADVIACREVPNERGGPIYVVTFAFSAPDGARLTADWSGERPFAPGRTVPVRYVRTPSVRIQPDDAWSAWGWAWVFGAGGGLVASLGASAALVGALMRHRRSNKGERQSGSRPA